MNDEERDEVEAEWAAELRRRVGALEDGEAVTEPLGVGEKEQFLPGDRIEGPSWALRRPSWGRLSPECARTVPSCRGQFGCVVRFVPSAARATDGMTSTWRRSFESANCSTGTRPRIRTDLEVRCGVLKPTSRSSRAGPRYRQVGRRRSGRAFRSGRRSRTWSPPRTCARRLRT